MNNAESDVSQEPQHQFTDLLSKVWPPGPTFVGFIALLAWIWLLTIGYSHRSYFFDDVSNEDLQEALAVNRFDALTWAWYWLAFGVKWRWTNIIYLCLAAGIAGEVGRWAAGRRNASPPRYISGAMRGFHVFLVVISGQVIVAGGFETPSRPHVPSKAAVSSSIDKTPAVRKQSDGLVDALAAGYDVDDGHYFRLAGAASLFSFLASLYPDFLRRVFREYVEGKSTGNGTSS
jgi:hypothetical protein